MDLFSERADRLGDQEAPLAARMRPRTLEEVGAVMGFSRERARQVERDALAALRSPEIRARLEDLVAA